MYARQVEVGDRVVIPGMRGRTVAWLAGDGSVEMATLRADYLEVPRCYSQVGDVELLAEDWAKRLGMTVHTVVRWDGGVLHFRESTQVVQPAANFILVEP